MNWLIGFVIAALGMFNFFALIADLVVMSERFNEMEEMDETSFQKMKAVQVYKVWHVLVTVCLLPTWMLLGALHVIVTAVRYILGVQVFRKAEK